MAILFRTLPAVLRGNGAYWGQRGGMLRFRRLDFRSASRRLLRDRRVLLSVCTVAGLLLAGAGWIAVTGVLARSELLAAQRSLDTLRGQAAADPTGGSTQRLRTVDAAVHRAAGHAARAHRLTTGPAWYLAAHLPLLGGPLRTASGIAEASDRLTHEVLPPLARTAAHLGAAAGADSGHLDLAALRRVAPLLERAARSASDVRTEVDALPHGTWLPTADIARARLAEQLGPISTVTDEAAMAARVIPPMLGADGPRRYLVVFENTAEARGTGGLPGAFAVVTAQGGRLRFEDFGNDTELSDIRAAVDLPDEYARLYGRNAPTRMWVNTNMSPHFPYAARIWAAAWRAHTGERLDGAFSLDPGALSGLLAASGSASLADGTAVTAANVVDLTQRTSYAAYKNIPERKAFFLDVARAVADRLMGTVDDPARRPALLTALRQQLKEGRVKVWSAHPGEQREVQERTFGGALPDGPAPLAGLVVTNAAGNKLDYYLERHLVWEPGRCTAKNREVTVTVRLANRAPASGLPSYVTQRTDKPPYPTRPGDNRLLVSYFASGQAGLIKATLDGQPTQLNHAAERGHPVYTLDLELPVGSTRTLVLHLLEPRSDLAPIVLRQPLVRPLQATVRPYGPCDG
ncbi:DUF4012 domain-containing protein [Streptomyces sp. NPDC006602]|uniref:DUF4012 domain-containing protein n=1 Tax=Streptomyces sp. NPDC006602 TaxID=3364751 RepID=UPI0036C85439